MNKKNILLYLSIVTIIFSAVCYLFLSEIFPVTKQKPFDMQRVIDYPIPKVLARYQKDYKVTAMEAKEHEKELKRYFIMGHQYPEECFEMYSDEVDNLWHTFLLYTKEYQKFCFENFGHFIHHNPIDKEGAL